MPNGISRRAAKMARMILSASRRLLPRGARVGEAMPDIVTGRRSRAQGVGHRAQRSPAPAARCPFLVAMVSSYGTHAGKAHRRPGEHLARRYSRGADDPPT